MIEENELSEQEIAADAAAEAAGMGKFYEPMLLEKRARAAKGHRKTRDKRFRLDGEAQGSAPTAAKTSDPWDASQIDYEEFHRLIQVQRPYMVHVLGDFQWAPNANKDALFDAIFQDTPRTPANLLRLYHLLCLKHSGGFPSFEGSLLCDLVVKILRAEGLIDEPVNEWSAGDPKTWIQRDSEGRIVSRTSA